MEKRQRKRVPLACLNCKKRKVRCDKKKPCTGCVKNNVGHLCVYVEPEWVELLAKFTQSAAGFVTELPDYIRLKNELEHMEMIHRVEMEKLKMELARAKELARQNGRSHISPVSGIMADKIRGRSGSAADATGSDGSGIGVIGRSAGISAYKTAIKSTPVTILRKLRVAQGSGDPTVNDDHYFTMSNFRQGREGSASLDPSGMSHMVNLYLWLNIIKLDPQLTALWYKITSLQKSYHIYKTTLLSQYQRGRADMRALVSDMVPRPSSPACGHHKCPVVACEFNLMVEESNRTGTPMGASSSESNSQPASRGSVPLSRSGSRDNAQLPSIKIEEEEKIHIEQLNQDAIRLLTRIQRLWAEIRNYGRGNGKLSYSQISFLLDFYLRDGANSLFNASILSYEVESQHLLRFFRADIMKLFVDDDDDVRLDIAVFLSEMNDSEVYAQLKLQGVYLLMLALIVEESLDALRLRRGLTPEIMAEFHSIFPLEAVHQGLGYKQTNVLAQVRDFIECMSHTHTLTDQINSLLLSTCLLVGLLNRYIAVYKKDGIFYDVRSAFTSIFTLTLDVLDQDGHRLELWSDPAQVVFQGVHVSKKRQTDLKLLLCQVWADFMRIINLVTFSTIPIVKHLHHLDDLLESFLVDIAEAEPAHAHIKYLAKLGESSGGAGVALDAHIAELVTSLHVNYLIARSSMLVRNGIYGSAARSRVCISDLEKCMAETAAWGSEITLTKLRMTRYFEVRTVFNYLEFYFSFIIFLQCEENGDNDMVVKLIPYLFAKCLDLNKFLQGSIIQFSKGVNYRYVLVAIAENVSRVSHLIAGLLIRFIAEPSSTSSGAIASPSTLIYSQRLDNVSPISIPVSSKDEIIRETDRTIQLLESVLSKDSVLKAIKIWRFYMTFIRNSHKMNPAAYAKLHAEAFGSGRILDACPVMPSLSTISNSPFSMSTPATVLSSSSRMTSCPVMHGPSRNRSATPALSRCPVDHTAVGVSTALAPSESQKRQCPFDHESPRNSSLGQTFHESNIRGRPGTLLEERSNYHLQNPQTGLLESNTQLGGPTEVPGITRRTPPQLATVVAMPHAMFSAQLLATPAPLSTDMMDWDTLPNFNFDLVGDEALMVQINGGDFNNPAMESMFQ